MSELVQIDKQEAVLLLKKLCRGFKKVFAEYEEKYCKGCDCSSVERCAISDEIYNRLLEITREFGKGRALVEWEKDTITIKIERVRLGRFEKESSSLTLIAKALASSESFKRIRKGEDYRYNPEVSYYFEEVCKEYGYCCNTNN